MDSNRTSFLVLKQASDFITRSLKFVWDGQQQVFRLEQQQAHFFPEITAENALLAWQNAPARVIDNYGQIGAISPDGKRFLVKADWQSQDWHTVLANSDKPDAQSIADLTLAPVAPPISATLLIYMSVAAVWRLWRSAPLATNLCAGFRTATSMCR
jgi:hypothetical protein